jgi:hypothetical protein
MFLYRSGRPCLAAAALAGFLGATSALAQSAPPVAEAPLRAHLSFLADDLLEGRGTGQRGAHSPCATSRPRPPCWA